MATLAGRTPLIGRDAELAALREHLEAAEQGQGAVVLLAGEPSTGKTRPAEELAAGPRSRGRERQG